MSSKKKKIEKAAPLDVAAAIEGGEVGVVSVFDQPAAPGVTLDDPALAAAIAEIDPPAPPAADAELIPPGQGDEQPPAVDLPVTIEPRILAKSLDVLAESWPVLKFNAEQRDLLAEVWAKPLDGLYQRLWKLLGANPETLGPWGQAVTVTAALVLPRLLPKIVKAASDRFRQDQPPAP